MLIASFFGKEKLIVQHHGGSWPLKHLKQTRRYKLFFPLFILAQIWENLVLKNVKVFYGLSKDEIIKEIIMHKKSFETQYPVLEVLSCYSRRAKVELISFHGEKAIKKTFKPSCEWFLENEIEAYTVFKDLKEVPRLLETGDNYFVISYIKGSKPLSNRISIRTLK